MEDCEDIEEFRRKISALYDAIMDSEDWILHPYQSHPRYLLLPTYIIQLNIYHLLLTVDSSHSTFYCHYTTVIL